MFHLFLVVKLCQLNYYFGDGVYLDGQHMQSYARDCMCTIIPTLNQLMTYASTPPQSGSTQCGNATFSLSTDMTSYMVWNCSDGGFSETTATISTTSPWRVRLNKTPSGLQLTEDIDMKYCMKLSSVSTSMYTRDG